MVGEHVGYYYDVPGAFAANEGHDPGSYTISNALVASVSARSSDYKREYHLNERWAQITRTGPPAPSFMVWALYLHFRRRKITARSASESHRRKVFKSINAVSVRKISRSMRVTRFAERWIDARMKALVLLGHRPVIRYPSNTEMRVIHCLFYYASKKFDQTYYKSGARRTKKDALMSSRRELARHNFPNYNYSMHQLHWMLGLRERCDCHFYWPLPKTPKVKERLQRMWEALMAELGWIYAPLETILDPLYKTDASSLVDAIVNECDGFRLPEGLPLPPEMTSL